MMESVTQISQITLFSAFGAGLLSFVSPCVLPLMPSYVSYITGLSIDQLRAPTGRHHVRKTIIVNSLLFIGGFSVVFIAFGLSASLFGQWLFNYQDYLRKIGGGLIVLFGLYVLGLFNFGFLSQERRLHFQSRPIGYLGSFLIGVTFAVGWTPCAWVLSSRLSYCMPAPRIPLLMDWPSSCSTHLVLDFPCLLPLYGSIGS
ncbi:cytochrome c biogenesis CcdA family protein [Nitrospira sp. Ecomares 2.1]